MRLFDWLKNIFKTKTTKVKKRYISDYEYNDLRKLREDKMNSILEKISKRGFDSLSESEKKFLNNYGKN